MSIRVVTAILRLILHHQWEQGRLLWLQDLYTIVFWSVVVFAVVVLGGGAIIDALR